METLPGFLPSEMQIPVLNLVTASEATLTVAVVIAEKSLGRQNKVIKMLDLYECSVIHVEHFSRGTEIDQLMLEKLSKEPRRLERIMALGPEAMTSLADVFTKPKTMDVSITSTVRNFQHY